MGSFTVTLDPLLAQCCVLSLSIVVKIFGLLAPSFFLQRLSS